MNLGTYRHYEEANVINGIFALNRNSGDKGTIVEISGIDAVATGFSPAGNDGWGPSLTSRANTWSSRYEVKARVAASMSGSNNVLGMLLYDVREVNAFGEQMMYRPQEQAEQQCVLSGQAVPIVTKGVFEVVGYSGTASGNAKAYVGQFGQIAAFPQESTGINGKQIGKFLGTSGVLGGALLKLEL